MRSLASLCHVRGATIGGSRALVRRGWPLALMRRQVVHRLPFDVDRLAPAFRILAPIWNKTPGRQGDEWRLYDRTLCLRR